MKNNYFLSILIVIASVVTIYHNIIKSTPQNMVRSDGSGYYAFLPYTFIYHDYDKVVEAEQHYSNSTHYPLYLHQIKNNSLINKYYPGVALLQAPFFIIAYFLSWLTGNSIDGYSSIFMCSILLGAVFYFSLGLIFYRKILQRFNCDSRWNLVILISCTPLLFQLVYYPSFSHVYSFGLFAVFFYFVLKINDQENVLKSMIGASLILGLIFLVRPTNCLIILFIPFLLQSKDVFGKFLKKVFRLKHICISMLSFFTVASILLLMNYIQTGEWLVWSYKGEGFDFLHPKIIQNWFSFRAGLFIHAPIFLLLIISMISYFKRDNYLFFAYLIYFLPVSYLISSWWCWDYETMFGNRAFTEHSFMLAFPVFLLLKERRTKILYSFVAVCVIIGIVRFYEVEQGILSTTRLSAQDYFKSLIFWKKENKERWNFNKSCAILDKPTNVHYLLNVPNEKLMSENDEFGCGIDYNYSRNNSVYHRYVRVEFDKKIESEDLRNVFLVYDETNSTKRKYVSRLLFDDCYEGKSEWKHMVIEENLPDFFKKYDELKVYIWNSSKKRFRIKNFKMTLFEYAEK